MGGWRAAGRGVVGGIVRAIGLEDSRSQGLRKELLGGGSGGLREKMGYREGRGFVRSVQ